LADFAKHFALARTNNFGDGSSRLAYKFASRSSRGYLEFMPSHSPELQPAERLWPLTNEAVANQLFQTLDDLEEVLFSAAVPY